MNETRKFLYYKTLKSFQENRANISDLSIVFIADSGQIWTHGRFFGGTGSQSDSSDIQELLQQIRTEYKEYSDNLFDQIIHLLETGDSTQENPDPLFTITGANVVAANNNCEVSGTTLYINQPADVSENVVQNTFTLSGEGYSAKSMLQQILELLRNDDGRLESFINTLQKKADKTYVDNIKQQLTQAIRNIVVDGSTPATLIQEEDISKYGFIKGVTISQSAYNQLVENNNVDNELYYFITEDDDSGNTDTPDTPDTPITPPSDTSVYVQQGTLYCTDTVNNQTMNISSNVYVQNNVLHYI